MQTPGFSRLLALLCLLATLTSFSCDQTPVEPEPEPTQTSYPGLNGLYVHGSNTIASSPSDDGFVPASVLDPGKGAMVDSLIGIHGMFLYIGANSTIELTQVINELGTTYGSAGGGSIDSSTAVNGSVNDLVINGTLEADGDPIQVEREGLYYLFVDVNRKNFVLTEVKANIIGDATDQGWTSGTDLPLETISKERAVFKGQSINMAAATGYRYRFNDGWHVYDDGTNIVTLSSLGVPSYAEAWASGVNDIGFHLDNIPQQESGVYSISLTYDAVTKEWSEFKLRTGDLVTDYATAEYGWFGNAYYDEAGNEGSWSTIDLGKTPTQNGDLYEWTWSLELIQDRSFVLRQDATNGEWVTFGGATKEGSAFSNDLIIQEQGQDNYYVVVGGEYDVTFSINSSTDERKLIIEPK